MSTKPPPQPAGLEVRHIPTSSIRRDGQTQHRLKLNSVIVVAYAALMRDGVIFPPVTLWWDGSQYWLSDGFHRIAAAEKAGFTEINAEVRVGSARDAQWHSYSANVCHGLRWSDAEQQQVVQLALAHPNAIRMSNNQLAKNLNVCEKTIRRWRQKVSSAPSDDGIRIVSRGKATYPLATDGIGRARPSRRVKSREDIRAGLELMKKHGSPRVRRLLVIVGNWALGSVRSEECLEAMELVLKG